MSLSTTASSADGATVNDTPEEWRAQLEALPSLEELGGSVPAVFLAHGQPMLIMSPQLAAQRGGQFGALATIQGPDGLLVQFLRDLGPHLLTKYRPKALVILSAHWETAGGGVTTDYGGENPLLYDYFGFDQALYEVEFKSRGDRQVAERVVELLQAAGIKSSRLTNKLEPRGEDGRGFQGPGLDHGVFVPLIHMFKGEAPIPVVQVSIPSDLRPETQHTLGASLAPLRSEGVLVVAGGLSIHTFRDFSAFSPDTAKPQYRAWEKSIVDAVAVAEPDARHRALFDLVQHPSFRAAHPREEHFVPLYVAQGAGSEGGEAKGARMVCGLWGAKTIVFGV
ncbi:uncharacterized protein RHOBADRAFT_28593 [Rhodotorula graminis WP1]|uniref:Extradiol ring-cleavage dioxygenase class III enzyme subunit B domain-containing protein n=1 Tax=Rhodotorula graminis (strain WP1) TaxID=578459 RepID=A0A0P9H0U1_RHOGW|nr:uncharacterized protein RHOBADRAFT_28593 [Rhodotorula graminis WP1]KPV73498.1 hypothetical protein RHOBADRAFT_28593 [Rhodotorula graminis WP1]